MEISEIQHLLESEFYILIALLRSNVISCLVLLSVSLAAFSFVLPSPSPNVSQP